MEEPIKTDVVIGGKVITSKEDWDVLVYGYFKALEVARHALLIVRQNTFDVGTASKKDGFLHGVASDAEKAINDILGEI